MATRPHMRATLLFTVNCHPHSPNARGLERTKGPSERGSEAPKLQGLVRFFGLHAAGNYESWVCRGGVRRVYSAYIAPLGGERAYERKQT